jgi:tripartite-type tricarboxylate transporter receptor subunit TctC
MKALRTSAWRASLASLLLLGASNLAFGAGYPDRAVRIIVPYQAGQGTDVATRYVADLLGRALNQSVYVENKGGAAGNIGAAEASRAPADGYTLVMGTNGTHVLNQYLYNSVGYDPAKDFEPIILFSTFPMVLLANPNSKLKTLKDVFAASATDAKGAEIAMPSTTARLVLELLKERAKVPLFGVPYKGSATATTDVIGGQLPLLIDTVSAARSFVDGGKLRPIVVTSLKNSALLPGVDSAAQQGIADFEVIAWNGLYAPKGTPAAVVQRLNSEINKLLARDDVKKRLLELGHEAAGGSPAKLGEFAASERLKWAPLIERAGIKAE